MYRMWIAVVVLAACLAGCLPDVYMSAASDGTIYVSTDGVLYRVDKDLSKAVVVADGVYHAEVSPDGKMFLCLVDAKILGEDAGENSFAMAILDDNGSLKQVLDLTTDSDAADAFLTPRWSPDGKFVSYIWRSEDRENNELKVVALDGSVEFALENVGKFYSWSPDSTSVCFVQVDSPDKEDAVIGRIKILGVDPREEPRDIALMAPSGFDWVGWDASGERILFGALEVTLPMPIDPEDAPLSGAIFAIGADGEGFKRLLDCGPGYAFLTISPDGARVLYAVWVDEDDSNTDLGWFDLYVAGVDGSNVVKVAEDGDNDMLPIWVGNNRVAFMKSEAAGEDAAAERLYVADVGGEKKDIAPLLEAAAKAAQEGEAEKAPEPAD
jgi:Tol biopolymer transport system component